MRTGSGTLHARCFIDNGRCSFRPRWLLNLPGDSRLEAAFLDLFESLFTNNRNHLHSYDILLKIYGQSVISPDRSDYMKFYLLVNVESNTYH